MSTVNKRIAKCRKLANLTQTDVAEKLNIKCSTYSQMERKGSISADRLFEMAKIFGVSPCHLFIGAEPCIANSNTLSIPDNEGNTTSLNQAELPFFKREAFTVTKKEQNLITLLRNLSRENYSKAMAYIQEIYKTEKN